MNDRTQNTLMELLAANKPFVVYRLPEENHHYLLIQDEQELPLLPYQDIEKLEGFIMAPFRGKKINHFYCIRPDTVKQSDNNDPEVFHLLNDWKPKFDEDTSVYTMTEKEYLDRAGYLVNVIRDGDLRKVVMSRVMEKPLPDTFQTGDYLQQLMDTYPKSFVYLASLPGHGIWIGATPEVLLMVSSGRKKRSRSSRSLWTTLKSCCTTGRFTSMEKQARIP
jgi:isochorismate synthase